MNGKDEEYTEDVTVEFLEYVTKKDIKNKKSILITGTGFDKTSVIEIPISASWL